MLVTSLAVTVLVAGAGLPPGPTYLATTRAATKPSVVLFTRTGARVRFVRIPVRGRTTCFRGRYAQRQLDGLMVTRYAVGDLWSDESMTLRVGRRIWVQDEVRYRVTPRSADRGRLDAAMRRCDAIDWPTVGVG